MPIVEKNAENIKKCLCPNCPTYNDCGKENKESLFCSQEMETDKCKYQMRGCVCPVCPVHKANNLRESFYCIHGPADKIEQEKR